MPQETKKLKFIIMSEYGEILDVAMALKDEGHEVYMHTDKEYSKIGENIIEKVTNWHECMGKGYLWLFDGCCRGNLQDWLRSKGELVFGGTEKADKLENDRIIGNQLFKSAGFLQPVSKSFKGKNAFDDAIKFVVKSKSKLILKQSGEAPKSLNHMAHFDNNEDLVTHLEDLKKKWNEHESGEVDFTLMEVVEGLEVAVSGFFNGKDWMRNKEGKAVCYLNFEEKKEIDGGLGETTGELGTTFIGTTEDNPLAKDIIFRPKITEVLKALNYKGVFDINCIKTKEGIVALEPTCRFGIPGSSYELIEGLKSPLGELLEAVAKGLDTPVEIQQGVGMVMVVAAKPFPVEAEMETSATSMGEKLWFLHNGKPSFEMTADQKKHIHLQNFELCEPCFCVATKNGYLLTVTGSGKTISEVREKIIQYIKDNIYISGFKYRTDIGKRVEEYVGIKTEIGGQFVIESMNKQYESKMAESRTKLDYLRETYENLLLEEKSKQETTASSYKSQIDNLISEYENKLKEEKNKSEEEITNIKKLIKQAVYE